MLIQLLILTNDFFSKLLLRIFDVVRHLRPCNTSHQDSVEMERFWNLQRSKYVNHNGAIMKNLELVIYLISVSCDLSEFARSLETTKLQLCILHGWNVNRFTAGQTKIEVGKLRTRVAQ